MKTTDDQIAILKQSHDDWANDTREEVQDTRDLVLPMLHNALADLARLRDIEAARVVARVLAGNIGRSVWINDAYEPVNAALATVEKWGGR